MSWTSNGFFRNVNIVNQLNSANGNEPVDLYQPGILNSDSLAQNARYSGFVTSLRLVIDLTSIAEIEFPDREIGMSNDEYNSLLRGMSVASPKKQLNLFLRTSDRPATKVGSIYLFNRRPYYTVDLLRFLTDATAFDVASDAVLSVQVISVGFGALSGEDNISVIGSAVEEAENTAPALNITVVGGGSGGSGASGNVVTTSSGDVVTDSQGNPVTV